ncbi:MAG: restriction endonuclease subunit S [Bacteroidetes bacterium]|nr:restriction endonuclease subunit S [Bacteroidota bacterium]
MTDHRIMKHTAGSDLGLAANPSVAGLAPYPAYKDSGIPWLGEVPEHWEVRRNKLFLREVYERSVDGSEDLLTVSQYTGVTSRRERLADNDLLTTAASLVGYKRVQPGDLVMNIMLAWNGSLGVSNIDGITSPAYCVFRASGEVEPRYLHYLFRSPLFTGAFKTVSTGVVDSRLRLYPDVFFRMPSVLPSQEEQSAIVRFLDHADRRIRKYIRAKKKLIALLNEQKQAIIHQAVTRGLDPNVRLKPSGIEWLGDVPEHWALARLKDAATVQTGLTLGKNYNGVTTLSLPYLRVANVQVGRVDLTNVKSINVTADEADGATLRAGDVLMTEGGDIDKLGRGCVWYGEIPGCLHQNHVFAVRCQRHVLDPEFLVGQMASRHGRTYFQLTAKQTTNLASTNSTTLRAFPILLPPIAEQRIILDEISRHTANLTGASDRAEAEITLLQEYRTRLIADVVTGRLDVREASARLPEEVPEVEDEALVDDDGSGDEAETGTATEDAEP